MNSIALATKYQPLLDKVFKKASVTQDLEAKESAVKFDGSNTVKILKIKLPSLGSYSRNSGFKTLIQEIAVLKPATLKQLGNLGL